MHRDMYNGLHDALTHAHDSVSQYRELAHHMTNYTSTLWFFAEHIQAKTIVEVGLGADQISGRAFVHSLANRGGRLFSFEHNYGCTESAIKLAKEKGVAWEIFRGNSLEMPIDLDEGCADLLYIDADHTEEAAYSDIKRFWPLLRAGGYCIVDDWGKADCAGIDAAIQRHIAEGLFRYVLKMNHGDGDKTELLHGQAIIMKE